ncbi:MAG TPA: hypothetical protein DDX85_07365, partial [Nitrospiraceae bacterium]|nr:hypothetical protein [Nitrospiraceae bacterium]
MKSKSGNYPDRKGHFGQYGGRFVPETLMPALLELERAYTTYKKNKTFLNELKALQKDFIGRPTPLYFASNLTEYLGGARIYLKREDLCHTGAHKINNAIAQALLARRMGKTKTQKIASGSRTSSRIRALVNSNNGLAPRWVALRSAIAK